MTQASEDTNKARKKLVLIFALYIIPLIVAGLWFAYAKSNSMDLGNRANGDLLKPTYPLSDFQAERRDGEAFVLADLRKHWTLLSLQPRDCDESCSKTLYNLRQLWYSFGKDAGRVGRVALFSHGSMDDKMQASHPKLVVVDKSVEGLMSQLRAADGELPACDDCIYLLDPLGNVVLRFDHDIELKAMAAD